MKDKAKVRRNEAIARFTDEEWDLVQWQSSKFNLSISQFVRFATVKTMCEIREAGKAPEGFFY